MLTPGEGGELGIMKEHSGATVDAYPRLLRTLFQWWAHGGLLSVYAMTTTRFESIFGGLYVLLDEKGSHPHDSSSIFNFS